MRLCKVGFGGLYMAASVVGLTKREAPRTRWDFPEIQMRNECFLKSTLNMFMVWFKTKCSIIHLIAAINHYTSKSCILHLVRLAIYAWLYKRSIAHNVFYKLQKKNPELSCLFKIAPKTINCVEWVELNLKNENPSFSQHCLVWNLDLEKTLYYNL